MSTLIKHKLLCITWQLLPKSAKGALYRRYRAGVVKRIANGVLYK